MSVSVFFMVFSLQCYGAVEAYNVFYCEGQKYGPVCVDSIDVHLPDPGFT